MSGIHIFGGGTVFHVRPHLAISAPAYGSVAKQLAEIFRGYGVEPHLHLTRMAGDPDGPETNADVAKLVDKLIADSNTRMIVMAAAMCDFEGFVQVECESGNTILTPSGKPMPRLKSNSEWGLRLRPADKIINRIRKARKDIFLIGFKTTAGESRHGQYEAGLGLLKQNSCNLVLANDIHTRLNMVVAPELAHYYVTQDREEVLNGLVTMALRRSRLTFTRTKLETGPLIDWNSPKIPSSLRNVVEYLVDQGAYQSFNNVTVGHFAFRESPDVLVSSRRKQNYNIRNNRDMVRVKFSQPGLSPGEMIAYGAKPSAGTTSQMLVLSQFPEYDCIVHAHVPLKQGSLVPVQSQHDFECGSTECGINTYRGMQKFGNLAAVMLDKHGPNIIFHRSIDPQEVINFLEANFDLTRRSDHF